MLQSRRAIPFAAALLAVLLTGGVATAQEAETPPEPEPKYSESGLRTDMWTAPDDPSTELSGYIAAQSWDTSYGGRDPNTTYGLTFGYFLTRWLEPYVVADFSLRNEAPADLDITSTQTYLGLGLSASYWFGFARAEVALDGGGLMRTTSYSDSFGTSGGATRFSPAGGFLLGIGVGLFGTAVVSFKGGARFWSTRSNLLFLLDVGWFFGG